MKTDRELLELAAKAAGLEFKWREGDPKWEPEHVGPAAWINGFWQVWNPLTDDGDALRLAVVKKVLRCHMDLFHRFYEEEMEAGREALEATRRAYVRAVVEIGEAR